MKNQKREHYRVVFPTAERPVLKTADEQFEVVDLSETGLRFVHEARKTFQIGHRLEGCVHFPDGTDILVDGSVVRTQLTDDGHRTALILATGIAAEVIIRAQQRIIRLYPGFTV